MQILPDGNHRNYCKVWQPILPLPKVTKKQKQNNLKDNSVARYCYLVILSRPKNIFQGCDS